MKKRTSRFLQWVASESAARPLTHDYLAKLTGLNRVTVTRAMLELQKSGQISLDKQGQIVIHSDL